MRAAASALPRLVAITDFTALGAAAQLERARALSSAARPGSLAILLRDHAASARQRLGWGRELRALTHESGQELWVADRVDLALTLQADAVHLGEASVTVTDARGLVGEELTISRAQHTSEPAAEELSALRSVDALLLSPVLEARKGRPALGLAAVGQLSDALARARLGARMYALGGVTAGDARACLDAGAWGVAAIGAAWSPSAFELLEALGIARSGSELH